MTWATRRVLGLLDLDSDLKQVVMEDLHPDASQDFDPSLLHGVDVTEYYGSESVKGADRIVVSQLKYSHSNPGRNWTTARLVESSNKGRASVIKRLAQIYAGLASSDERDAILGKLEIHLVSNQPLQPQLASMIGAAQSELDHHSEPINLAQLLKKVPVEGHADLKKIKTASGLGTKTFTDFLRLLRLRGGQDGQLQQELEVTDALSVHVKENLKHHSLAIYNLVMRRGLPDSNGAIVADDLLAVLEVTGMDDLLPAPFHFEELDHYLPTDAPKEILKAMRSDENRIVLAHGHAGVGKTTSARQAASLLPAGSVFVEFDCFAGGAYLTPAQARHSPETALLHLCNELAVKCRLPLLIVPPKAPDALWREFQRRLDSAAANLHAAGSEIVILVDAADNAVWAASKRGDKCFVPDLWSLNIPNGAGLVVTARTQRREQLEASAGTTEVELRGFDPSTSTSHFRTRYPDASDEQGSEFHERSLGNPRVQSYVLGTKPSENLGETISRAKRKPEQIFEEMISEAVDQNDDESWAAERLADLVCLASPTSPEHMAEVANSTVEDTTGFCLALAPGLSFDDNQITFQDEDFEAHVLDRVGAEHRRAAHSRLADHYVERAPVDPHAATVLAEHLYSAERKEDLIALAVDEGQPESIHDPIASLQVYRLRLRLALQSSSRTVDRVAAAKMLVLAGRAAGSDSAVSNVIRSRPMLALRHGDPVAVEATWRDVRNLHWQGPMHMRLAALHARRGSRDEAIAELRMTDAWMRRYLEEDQEWDFKPADYAAALEAIYLLHGWEQAIKGANRWRPLSFRNEICVELARRLGPEPTVDVCEGIFTSKLPVVVKARMLVAHSAQHQAVPTEKLIELATQLARRRPTQKARSAKWPIAFIELVAEHTLDEELVLSLLERWEPPLPTSAPRRYSGSDIWEAVLRAQTLRAACVGKNLDIADLMPISVTREDSGKSRQDDEERAMHRAIAPLISVYERRASAFLRRPMAHSVTAGLRKEIGRQVRSRHDIEWEYGTTFIQWLNPACDILKLARGSSIDFVREAADAAAGADGEDESYVWKALAKRLIVDERYRQVALELIIQAGELAQERDQPTEHLSDFLLDLTEIADPFDSDVASDLYSQAIRAAEGLDDDVVGLLETHSRLAPRIVGDDAAPAVAARLAQSIITYRNRVSSEEILPWEETVHAVTSTHPPSGSALVGRWEDERHMRIEESLGAFLKAALEAGFLDVSWAIGLMGLLGEQGGWHRELRPVLEELRAGSAPVRASELKRLAQVVMRDLSGAARENAASIIVAWANANGHGGLQVVGDLSPYMQDQPIADSDYNVRRRARLDAALEGAATASPEEIVQRLQTLTDEYGSDADLAKLVVESAYGRGPTQKVALLDALAAISPDEFLMRFHAAGVIGGVAEVIGSSQQAAVRDWSKANVKRIAFEQIQNLVRYREHRISGLRAWSGLLTQDSADFAIEAAASHIDELPPHAFYALAEMVGESLGERELTAFLDWSLGQVEEGVENPMPVVGSLDAPEALAGLLWSLFANPEKPVRWRAAHAARRLICHDHEPPNLAGSLLKLANTTSGGEFASPNLRFLWMPARTWTLMTLARVAADKPDALILHSGALIAAALDGERPHASQRTFAARAALRVAENADSAIPADVGSDIRFANQPQLCFAERGHHYNVRYGDYHQSEDWNFSLDVDDTWFSRLGEKFGKGKNEIAELARRWLIDVLGESYQSLPIRDDLRISQLDYGDLDLHHNSEPRAESVRVALEYYAMHLVAGELVSHVPPTPILVEDFDPPNDPWEDWLEHHLDASEYGWTVDRRDPTPPEPVLLHPAPEGELWPAIDDDHCLFMLGHPDRNHLVVAGLVSYSYESAYGWDSIDSALVGAGVGHSLKFALDTASEPQFFSLPTDEEEDDFSSSVINHGKFQLHSWLRKLRTTETNLEKHDPLARLTDELWTPGQRFQDLHGTVIDPFTGAHASSDGIDRAWVRAFSDQPPQRAGREIRSFHTSGSQTFVESAALLSFLEATDASLIITAEAIRRELRSTYIPRNDEQEEKQEVRLTVLIEQDGTVHGLPGCRSIR